MAGGYAICPYCKATVQPQVGPDGRKLCPSCRNTGQAQSVPPASGPSPGLAGQPPPARPTAPGAVGSLVCGVAGIVLSGLGLVLGPIAVVLAGSARKAMAREPGRYQGDGLATAGRVCGIIAIVLGALSLLIVLGVFLAVSQLNLDPSPDLVFGTDAARDRLTVLEAEAGLEWGDFEVSGTAGCVLPAGEVDVGDIVLCANDGTVRIRHVPSDEVVLQAEV